MIGDIEVGPTGRRWYVRVQGRDDEFGAYWLKIVAEAVGRAFARDRRVELIVRGRNGRIQRRDSYGNDRPDRSG